MEFVGGSIDAPMHWQWFDDQKKGRVRPGHRYGTLEDLWDDLVERSIQGAGIYGTINRTDGVRRKKGNIVCVRSVFLDMDGAPLELLKDSPIKFHLLVESSPGRYHAYLKINPIPIDDGSRAEISELFEVVQGALAERFQSDPSVTDLSRVMRVPGFYHRKDTPFLSRILAYEPQPPVDISEVIKNFNMDVESRRGSKKMSNRSNRKGSFKKILQAGERNKSLFKEACHLRDRRIHQERVEHYIRLRNQCDCKPPLSEEEIETLLRSAFSYAARPGPKDGPSEGAERIFRLLRERSLGVGHCRLGRREIALSVGLHKRQVTNCVHQLEKLGMIRVVGRKGLKNLYFPLTSEIGVKSLQLVGERSTGTGDQEEKSHLKIVKSG